MDSKCCSKCLEDKPLSDFHRCNASQDGLQYKCRVCSRIATVVARSKRLAQDSEHDKKVKRAWYAKNSEISKARAKQYRLDHPEWAKEMDARQRPSWRKQYPEKAKALGRRQAFKRKLRKYGLSPEEFQAMITKQEGKCAVCGVVPPDGLVIDHNHKTGNVRELLCNPHNVALGMIQDNPEIARQLIYYLEKHS